jgi:phage protein D
VTDSLLAAASPVFSVGGQVADELKRDLLHLEVEERADGLRTLRLRLLAWGPSRSSSEDGLLYLDGRLLDFGKSVSVSIGPGGEDATIFEGAVSGIEVSLDEGREPEVLILAEDKLMDLRMTRRMKTYDQKSDEQIAQEIADKHSLGCTPAAPGPTYDVVQQWNVSDLAFLRERAARIQAEVWIEGSTLHFESRANRSAPSLTLVQGNQLIAVTARGDLAHQRTAVKVSGYDANGRRSITEEAGSSALAAEAAGGQTGPSVLQRAFGARTSFRVLDVPLVSTEARDWAKAEMLRRGRGFVTVEGVTRGSPTLLVGGTVKLERVGPPFDGDDYRVIEMRHTYDLTQGYRTHFRAERPTINARGAA